MNAPTTHLPTCRTVGRENLFNTFSKMTDLENAPELTASAPPPHHHTWCSAANSSVADCFRAHALQKLTKQDPGFWYS